MTDICTRCGEAITNTIHMCPDKTSQPPFIGGKRDPLLVEREKTHDDVNHPKHYTNHPSGVECIQVTEHMNFNIGNAVKYLWRAGEKGNRLLDLKKAAWYVNREVERLERNLAK